MGAVSDNNLRCAYSPNDGKVDVVAPSGQSPPEQPPVTGPDYAHGSDSGIVTLDRMGNYGLNSGNYMYNAPDGSSLCFSGTSASAPQVAGIAALMLPVEPNATSDTVKSQILNSATSYGQTNWAGHGRVNAYQAYIAAGGVYKRTEKAIGQPGGPYVLHQNYPNPFNPSTSIGYELPTQSYVTLKVYDVLGQEIATLIDGVQDAGFKSVQFNSRDKFGNTLPSGVYIYRIVSGKFVQVKKMLLAK